MERSFFAQHLRRRNQWFAFGLLAAIGLFVMDAAATGDISLIGAFGVAPFVAAVGASRRQTAVVAVFSVALALLGGVTDGFFGNLEHLARTFTVLLAAAVAVQVAKIRERSEASSELQYVMAQTLAMAPSLAEATPQILERVAGVLGWHAGAIWVVDQEAGVLRCANVWHAPGMDIEPFLRTTREAAFPPGVGLPGRVWRQQEALWIEDVARDSNFSRAGAAADAGLRAGLGFPITAAGEFRGVIELFTRDTPRSDPALLGVMASLGAQLGQYIERRLADEAANRSQALKSAVIESSLDCVITMDHHGHVLDFSPSAERTFGYDREEAVGRELAELIVPPDLRDAHRQALARYVESGVARMLDRRLELTGMRSDGSLFPVELSITRVGDADPPTFAGYLRDITQRLQTERERERLLEREREERRRAERLERRASYLTELQGALDASFDDYQVALRKLARLLVPHLADWCAIHTLEEGELQLVAVEHSDAGRRQLAWDLQERYPTDMDSEEALAKVLRTGRPELIREIPDGAIEIFARDEEHAAMMRRLGLGSVMIVPLGARGQTLGAITFALAESARAFEEEELAFAREVARRAALSIDNARLYRELRQRQVELEFLARASIELDSSLDLDETLQRLADLTVPGLADGCMVDLLEEGARLRRVASASGDPAIEPVLDRLRSHDLDLEGSHPIAQALRTGELQVVEEITADHRRRWAADRQYLDDLEAWPGRTVVVAPMKARGRMLGTITLTSFGERRFSRPEIAVIQELARRAATSVYNSLLYSERSYIASRLQHSLLPPHLPEVPGLEIAARFRPAGEANEVGGDFYDIFQTGDDRWAVVIGDVCGKGADAAAVTAIARYTLRAGAMRADDQPEQALRLLNEVLLQQVTPDRFCTVGYASLDLTGACPQLCVASGGHPMPLLLQANGSVAPVGKPGTLLGVVTDPVLFQTPVDLAPGDSMIFYTDGLIEARLPDDALFDLDRLIDTLEGCRELDPAGLTTRIEQQLTDLNAEPRDDIAILIVQASGERTDAPAPGDVAVVA